MQIIIFHCLPISMIFLGSEVNNVGHQVPKVIVPQTLPYCDTQQSGEEWSPLFGITNI